MKKIGILAGALALFAGALAAQSIKKYSDKKAKFSIEHPSDWTKKVNSEGMNLFLMSPDQGANVIVVKESVPAGTKTAEYLAKGEADAGDGRTNLVPEDKRMAADADLKNMNVDEASLGIYQVDKDGAKLNQMFMVMRKGKAMYSVILTYREDVADQYKDVITKIGDSFKALK